MDRRKSRRPHLVERRIRIWDRRMHRGRLRILFIPVSELLVRFLLKGIV